MASPSSASSGEDSTPFLLKVFYRANAFHRPEEFSTTRNLPPHLPIYTFKNCTLSELSRHVAAASPSLLPDPAIGTRLIFRVIFADTRGGGGGGGGGGRPDASPRFIVKDLGSVVIGEGEPGVEMEEGAAEGSDGDKTLNDGKFIVGDYISCAILPPSDITGEVATTASIRDMRSTMGVAPPRREGGFGGRGGYGRGDHGRGEYGRGNYGRDSRGEHPRGFGGGRYADRDRGDWRGLRGGVPDGEWRRGERLPDPPMGSGRGPR